KTAWNHFFHRRRPCFMLFHLKNGNLIGGYYGMGSYVATFPHAPEVYVSQTWKMNDGHFVEPIENTLGMVIRFADCDLIEFLCPEESSDDGQEQSGEVRGQAVVQAPVSNNHT